MAANPIPVNIIGDNQTEPQTKRQRRTTTTSSVYKYLQRIDGFGQYARIIFYSESLEQANSTISKLHSDKVFDNFLTHAYTKHRDGREVICVHGIFHLVSRDFDVKYLREKLPKASISVSFYPEASYPRTQQKSETSEVLQEGYATGVSSFNNFNNALTLQGQDDF